MNNTQKVLTVAGIIVTLIFVAMGIYQIHYINERQNAIETQIIEQKQIAENITRAMSTWATKADLEKLAADSNTNLADIKKDLAKLNANLTAIHVSSANSTGQNGTKLPSTGEVKDPDGKVPTILCDGKEITCADPHGYYGTTQEFSLNEKFANVEVPFGKVGFSAAQKQPWSVNVSPRQYNSVTVIGTDENQRMYAYNKFSIHTNNKDYDVPVTSSQIKQEYPEPKLSLINPRLYLGFDAGINVTSVKAMAGPSVKVQVSSYGKYKNQPDLSILQLGVNYDIAAKETNFMLTPVSYNIGQHLPLMNNLYVGPSVSANLLGQVGVSLGLNAGL